MLSTHRGGAHTVLGTPYYISPEMCEGKVYDEKSDIWALGCILYEMAALQKTFEGSNLPALVNKIMKGQFAPIRGNYTPLFKQLVRFGKYSTQSKLDSGSISQSRKHGFKSSLQKGLDKGSAWVLD